MNKDRSRKYTVNYWVFLVIHILFYMLLADTFYTYM